MARVNDWLRLGSVGGADENTPVDTSTIQGPKPTGKEPVTADNSGPKDLSAPGSINLNIPYLEDAANEQDQLLKDRQAADAALMQKQYDLSVTGLAQSDQILDASAADRQVTRDKQLEILGGIDGQLTKAQRAIALSDSDNPLDRLTLWGLQQVDPAYTREGNIARIQYLQTAADAVGSRDLITQSGYQDQLSELQRSISDATLLDENQLEILKKRELQGQERLNAAKDLAATRLGILQTQNTTQDLVLGQLDDNGVALAEADASRNNGTAMIGGVAVPITKITERKESLANRNYLSQVLVSQQQTLAASEMLMPDVVKAEADALGSKDGMAEFKGVKVSLAHIQDRKTTLMNQDAQQTANSYSIANMTKGLLRDTQERVAATYSITELNKGIMNNGQMEGLAVPIPLDILTSARDMKSGTQAQELQTEAARLGLGDPSKTLVDTAGYLDGIKAAPNSPLAQQIQDMKSVTANAAQSLAENSSPANKVMIADLLSGVRQQTEAAITSEAKRLSQGDKDLETAYSYQLRGQQVPSEVIEGALQERVSAGKPLGNWLTPVNAGTYIRAYGEAVSQINAQQLGSPVKMDKKSIDQQAAGIAMETLKGQIAGGMSDQILAYQLNGKDNPLIGVLNGSRILQITHDADVKGAEAFRTAHQMKPEDLQALMKDSSNPLYADLASTQASFLYQSLEQVRPGLGQQYVNWWAGDNRMAMQAEYGQNAYVNQKTAVQQMEMSLVLPTVPDQMAGYAQILQSGQQQLFADDLQRQHTNFVTFGNNPQSNQVFLLEQDHNLNGIQKQQIMKRLIQPLIAQAADTKKSYEETTKFIEMNLRSMQPEDAQDAQLLKLLLKGREASLKVVDDFLSIQPDTAVINPFVGPFRNPANEQAGRISSSIKTFDWWKQMQATP